MSRNVVLFGYNKLIVCYLDRNNCPQKTKNAMSSWLRCWRISLTDTPASPVPSPLFISAMASSPTIERNECMYANAPEKRWRSWANTWCASHGYPQNCDVRRSRDHGPGLAVTPTCSPAASTHTHARPPSGSISNQDHSFNKGHSNAWNGCMQRLRSHPWLQDHVFASLLIDTDLNV